MNNWIDDFVRWISEAFAHRSPVDGWFEGFGYALAGVPNSRPLPVGPVPARGRSFESGGALAMVGTAGTGMSAGTGGGAGGAVGKGGGEEEELPTEAILRVNCSDRQYCRMHGHPCSCCGGSDSRCPSGAAAGSYWSACCGGRRIYFRDCCGGGSCPSGCPWCSNSNEPNWCGGAGGNRYLCTMAEDHGRC